MPRHGKCSDEVNGIHKQDRDGRSAGCRILIVGAGFAGLSAAKTLQAQTDSQIIILEASGAVGGRARRAQLPSGGSVELGATWFHGIRDNPVYDMAVWSGVVRDLRLDTEATKHDVDWQLHFARPHEKQLLTGELSQVAMEAISNFSEAAEECTQGAQPKDCSVGDVLRRTYDEIVTTEGFEGEKLQTFADAWHHRETLQRTFDGFYSTDDVSLAFAREFETLEGPNVPVPGGYQALAEILAQGLDIRFQHRVSKIEYGPQGAIVFCDNGEVFDASCVIVTTSLGVLQSQHKELFSPPLPQWKVDALSSVRIGVADKVFIEFEIDPSRAREAAVWLSSHANLGTGPSHPSPALTTPSPEHPSTQTRNNSPPGSQFSVLPTPVFAPISPEIASLLPPPATGGLPEPFNLGKRPVAQLWPAQEARIARLHAHTTAVTANDVTLCLSEDSTVSGATTLTSTSGVDGRTAARTRRRKHKRTIHSYSFLWPVSSPQLLGCQGHPALQSSNAQDPRTTPLCMDVLVPTNEYSSLQIPTWVQGLHSIRYCPGPEWITPSLLQEGGDGGKGKRTSSSMESAWRAPNVHPVNGGATHVSGVLWITGHSALGMEAATDEEVADAITNLFKLFPQVPVPPGATFPPKVVRSRWGLDPLFQGSYSYVNVTEETGEAVDTLAEPLCNDDGIPIVLFAGEATYRPCIGTVHGAFLSGCREAERLLEVQRPSMTVPDAVSFEAARLDTHSLYVSHSAYSGGVQAAEIESAPLVPSA